MGRARRVTRAIQLREFIKSCHGVGRQGLFIAQYGPIDIIDPQCFRRRNRAIRHTASPMVRDKRSPSLPREMISDHAGDTCREFFPISNVQEFIRTMRIRLRSEHARNEKLRGGEFVAEHSHERNGSAFTKRHCRPTEKRMRCRMHCGFEPRRGRRSIPALRRTGCSKRHVRAIRRILFERFFEVMQNVPTDNKLWEEATEIAWQLQRKGLAPPAQDILIAASAKWINAAVLTYDSHFEMNPGLRVYRSLEELR